MPTRSPAVRTSGRRPSRRSSSARGAKWARWRPRSSVSTSRPRWTAQRSALARGQSSARQSCARSGIHSRAARGGFRGVRRSTPLLREDEAPMSDENSVFDRWRARGEAVFNQVSEELMKNPNFVKAMQAAMKGKERVDVAVGQALKAMNVPTRSEFRRAVARIEALERELAALKAEREEPVLERRRTKPKLRPRPRGAR
ncbi:MAG: hypothetical protein DMF83_30430 [Acidobacteria bacterium]|nr:MAG: hypothetical protein DMF83_30430 [Acidobacteriota bacterium]